MVLKLSLRIGGVLLAAELGNRLSLPGAYEEAGMQLMLEFLDHRHVQRCSCQRASVETKSF